MSSLTLRWLTLTGLILLLVMGTGLSLRLWPRLRTYIPKPVIDRPLPTDGDYRDIIFLHHSTGRLLIEQGHLRQYLTDLGYRFWDHGYNFEGLTDPDGATLWGHYAIPGGGRGGNTDVEGLATLFAQPVTDPPSNAFSRLLQHEVIITKSCFPNNALSSEGMVAAHRAAYLRMRDSIDHHPDRLFILLTTPPLHPLATTPQEAARARTMAGWLTSPDFRGDRPNLAVFDFFDQLADPETHMLRAEYQLSPNEADSHPNQKANRIIAPRLGAFIDEAIKTYINETEIKNVAKGVTP